MSDAQKKRTVSKQLKGLLCAASRKTSNSWKGACRRHRRAQHNQRARIKPNERYLCVSVELNRLQPAQAINGQ